MENKNQMAIQGAIVTAQCLKDLARPLLATLEFDSVEGSYKTGALPEITPEVKENAKMVLFRTEQHLKPAEKQDVLGHVFLLLQHYYTAELPKSVHDGLASQWYEVLKELPEWAVRQAITDYLAQDSKGKKPVPGMIKDLANKVASKSYAVAHQCRKIIAAPLNEKDTMTEEEKIAMRKRVEAVLAETKKALSA